MVQGINKSYIFQKNFHKVKYINLIKEKSKEFNIKIISYTIMNNHAHFCFYYDSTEELSKYMHKVNSIFAHFFNFTENRVGYLFRDRFKVQEIMTRTQLYNVISYIHNNPKKAKLVDKLEEYQYSSYNDYVQNNIEKEILLLVFETEKYKDIFNYIHKNYDEIGIMDIDKNDVKEVIKRYIEANHVSLKLIKKDKNLLFELVKILYETTDVKNKELCEMLGIDKNRVTRMKQKILDK